MLRVKEPKIIDNSRTIVQDVIIDENKEELHALKEINFQDIKLHFIPRGFQSPFKDITKLTAITCQLKEVHRADLSQFPKLKILWLWGNDLEVIESDLFQANPQLELIDLGTNKIWFIAENSFKNLKALEKVKLNANLCIDGDYENTQALGSLNSDVKEKCAKNYFVYLVKGNLERKLLQNSEKSKENFKESSTRDLTGVFTAILLFIVSTFIILLIHCANKRKFLMLQGEIKKLENSSVKSQNRAILVNAYEEPNFGGERMYEEIKDNNGIS